MLEQTPITGILLAGGKSSRMGTDKGLLPLQGIPIIQHCINAIKSFVDSILIITANNAYKQFGYTCHPDVYTNLGPLGGIYTGLHHSSTKDNLVVSCDTPFISKGLLQLIINQHTAFDSITTVNNSGRLMPTFGIYQKQLLSVFEGRLKQKMLKLTDAVMAETPKIIEIPSSMTDDLININTQEDYRDLTMTAYKIYYFGMIAECTACEQEVLTTKQHLTVAQLNTKLKEKYPKLDSVSYKIAVDKSFVALETPITNKQEIALLPPFAGG